MLLSSLAPCSFDRVVDSRRSAPSGVAHDGSIGGWSKGSRMEGLFAVVVARSSVAIGLVRGMKDDKGRIGATTMA